MPGAAYGPFDWAQDRLIPAYASSSSLSLISVSVCLSLALCLAPCSEQLFHYLSRLSPQNAHTRKGRDEACSDDTRPANGKRRIGELQQKLTTNG